MDSLDQMAILFNTFRSHHTAFHSDCSLLPSLGTDVPFSTSSPALVICGLFVASRSDMFEVVSHLGFDLLFSN